MRIATYCTEGMFRGQVRTVRQIEGEQLWRVVVTTQRESGAHDTDVIDPKEPLLLSSLGGLVQKTIDDLCQPGDRLTYARMDFFVRKKA